MMANRKHCDGFCCCCFCFCWWCWDRYTDMHIHMYICTNTDIGSRQFMKFSLIFDRSEFLLMPRMWCPLTPSPPADSVTKTWRHSTRNVTDVMKFCDMYDRTFSFGSLFVGVQLLTGVWKSIPFGNLFAPDGWWQMRRRAHETPPNYMIIKIYQHRLSFRF